MLKLHPVESSNIAALGYDEKEGKLHVQFHQGSTWIYSGVTMDVYDDLMEAESIGSFFFHHIKGKYPGVRQ